MKSSMSQGQVLETDRLILRELSLDDQEALHRILSDPITMRFWPAPFTPEATQQWIERSRDLYAAAGFGRWATLLKDTGELIGTCGLARLEVDGVLENDLGYIVDRRYWGYGYATEAAEGCKRYAIESLGLPRLVANMPVDHHASRRVAEKIGMTWEKTFNNSRNRGIPTHVYALAAQPQPAGSAA